VNLRNKYDDNYEGIEMFEQCSECESGEVSAKKKEMVQERIRILRKAVALLCNNDPALINQAMCNAEEAIFGKEVKLS
jgi:hypothetical protein